MSIERVVTETAQPSDVKPRNASQALAELFSALGVRYAFGVSGGAIAAIWGALSASDLEVVHCRHESGAVFAATEAHFASGSPVAVFVTTGPGLTNALTGILAAKDEGAKIILVSGHTTAANRGRWAIQETDNATLPPELFAPGPLFDMATVVESVDALPQIAQRLANGLARPGGFVCHLALPTGVQGLPLKHPLPDVKVSMIPEALPESVVDDCVTLLTEGQVALWLGFGARGAAAEIRVLAEQLNAPVLCSPRAKGIFPETHPLFVGVTGMGGHESVQAFMRRNPPRQILVLGTRLGEPTSFWDPLMIPEDGFIHVDIDPSVPGVAYPQARTYPVRADIRTFVSAILDKLPLDAMGGFEPLDASAEAFQPQADGKIRPEVLMSAIQRIAIDKHDCLVMAESGNSFTWATHYLRFARPDRYRVSTGVGSMGHFASGVTGAALAGDRTAVAIAGDGAMLMTNELSTAVHTGAPAIWIVLNDARYNMCEQGMAVLGLQADASIPQVNFALYAQAMGAGGLLVESETELEAALETAIAAQSPYVLDIRIDPAYLAPSMARNRGLRAQGVGSPAKGGDVSFPPRA